MCLCEPSPFLCELGRVPVRASSKGALQLGWVCIGEPAEYKGRLSMAPHPRPSLVLLPLFHVWQVPWGVPYIVHVRRV